MQTKSILTRLKKYPQAPVNFDAERNHYTIIHDGKIMSFYDQQGRATALHIKGVHEKSDIQSDYFPGFFPRTLVSALYYLGLTK